MDLDALLASMNSAAAEDLAGIPLLEAVDFSDAAPDKSDRTVTAAHVYVGCIGKWLAARGALTAQRSRSNFDASATPATFSRTMLHGVLRQSDITDAYAAFAAAYIRDTGAYGYDYVEAVVVPEMRRDMFDVPDSEQVYAAVAARVEERFAKFSRGDQRWHEKQTTTQHHELSISEQSTEGWLAAFPRADISEAQPEATRRENLARFWALVDHAPNVADRRVAQALLSTFHASADSSVQQSVLNALAAMPFDIVIREVSNVATELERGGWLSEILGVWRGDFSDAQMQVLELVLAESPLEQRNAIYRASRSPDYLRSRWAIRIQGI